MRLKSDMRRADKEIQFYRDKVEMSQHISKIEARRAKKTPEVEEIDGEDSVGHDEKITKKRMKNVKKIIDYHQRKRRDFKQREPILEEGTKRPKTE